MTKRWARSTLLAVSLGSSSIAGGVASAAWPTPATAGQLDPAYPRHGPTVAIDDAPGNAATGLDKQFADLLTRDGYRVVAVQAPFEAGKLRTYDVLVVGAAGSPATVKSGKPTGLLGDRDCDLARDWVRGGGSLLLAVGAPSSGSARLAPRFGVEAGGGRVFDRVSGGGITTGLEFSRDNGLLGEHPIVHGRGRADQVARVLTLTGQSLGAPRGAAVLLKLSETAREAATRNDLESEEYAARQEAGIAGSFSIPVAGRAQAIALSFGKGRLVALGDPDFLSAGGSTGAAADNRQFVLNAMHWLSRLLP